MIRHAYKHRHRLSDVVTLRTRRNDNGRLVINGSRVIGSSAPCANAIRLGCSLRGALDCLKRNGFVLVYARDNVFVLRRWHRHRL